MGRGLVPEDPVKVWAVLLVKSSQPGGDWSIGPSLNENIKKKKSIKMADGKLLAALQTWQVSRKQNLAGNFWLVDKQHVFLEMADMAYCGFLLHSGVKGEVNSPVH